MSAPEAPVDFDLRAAADWIRANAHELAERVYGIAPGARGSCALHGGDGDNFAVHDNGGWSCFSRCGHGDLIKWVAAHEHGHPVEEVVRGELFRRVVLSLVERAGRPPEDFQRGNSPDRPDKRGAKPYPPRAEVDAVLAEAVHPIYALRPDETDRALELGGRARPGLPSFATLSGLDLDGPGLVRIISGSRKGALESRPEWARSWRRRGAVVPTYDGRGALVSLVYRRVAEPCKGFVPKGFSAGPLFLNRPARELLAREATAVGARAVDDARDRGVLLTEGMPAHLAWSWRHAGPVIGIRGGSSIPHAAILAIPRDAPVLLDFDPDAAGEKYLRDALRALRSHTDVRWSARMAWYAERYPAVRAELLALRTPRSKAERDAVEREIAERLDAERVALAKTNPRLLDPDEVEGGPGLEAWGFAPIPPAVREELAGTRSSDGTWKDRLRWGEKGLEKSTGNALLILQNDERWRGVLAYDERSDELKVMREPPVAEMRSKSYPRGLRDADETWIVAWIEAEYGIEIGANKVHSALVAIAEQQSFDRVREYLEEAGKRWDGTARIDTWLVRFLGAADTPLNRAIGAKWLISAVARALDPGCKVDHVLVLEGRQGAGKSSALAALCADEDWFTDQVPDLRDQKAAAEILQGPWIVELAELAALGRAETERTKAWITTRRDRYRSPWGKNAQGHPRRCVFAATTNADAYLKDPTGARRWWPVEVGIVDVEALREARGQLWAEAVVRYRKGERWYLDTAELAGAAEEASAERYEGDAWDELIGPYLAKKLIRATEHEVFVSMGDLLEAVGVKPEQQTRAHETRVGALMRTMKGWKRARAMVGGQRVRGYAPSVAGQPAPASREVGQQVGQLFGEQYRRGGQPGQPGQPNARTDGSADEEAERKSIDDRDPGNRSATPDRLARLATPGETMTVSGGQPRRLANLDDDFADDEPEPDPIAVEIRYLADRWAEGVGPKPRWPFQVRDRFVELYRERRTGPPGTADVEAGRYAAETAHAEAQAALAAGRGT